MIQNAQKIDTDRPELQTRFQLDIFNHWQELKGTNTFPYKRDFRPQKFPQFLGQLATISVDSSGVFSDSLTGSTVCDVLKLSSGPGKLMSPPDLIVKETIQDILDDAYAAKRPMYYSGRFQLPARPPVEYTVLIVPFSKGEDHTTLQSLLLAFDFSKQTTSNLL